MLVTSGTGTTYGVNKENALAINQGVSSIVTARWKWLHFIRFQTELPTR